MLHPPTSWAKETNQWKQLQLIGKRRFAIRKPTKTSRAVLRFLRSLVRRPFRRFAWQKMGGILAIRKRSHSLTQSIRAGEIAPSFLMDATRSSNFWSANG